MSAVVKNKLLLHADDYSEFVSGKNITHVEKLLTESLSHVSQWLIDYKLSRYLGQTGSIFFGSKYKIKSNTNLNVTCTSSVIEPTTNVKYFGATLDQSLSFDSMASSVLQKANAILKFIYRKKEYLT